MAWTYSDWPSQDGAQAQLDQLNLHIAEVADKVSNELSADGFSRGSSALQAYLDSLMKERVRLDGSSARAINGGVSTARLTPMRNVR